MIATLLAGMALAAGSGPPCPASQWSAKVTAMSPIKGAARSQRVTRSGKTPQPVSLAEGDILCAGEIITNPAASGMSVVIGLPLARDIALAPDHQFSIPQAGVVTRLAVYAGQFDRLFSPESFGENQTRGPGGQGAQEGLARAVPGWGALLLSWEADGEGPWLISLTGDNRTLVATSSRAFARIDLTAHCSGGCAVTVTRRDGTTVARRRIVPSPPSDAPFPIWLNEVDGTESRALVGIWLVEKAGDPSWIEQGYGLLWSAACAYPAVYERLARHVPEVTMHDPCGAPPLAFAARS